MEKQELKANNLNKNMEVVGDSPIGAGAETKFIINAADVRALMEQDRPTDVEIGAVEEDKTTAKDIDIPNGLRIYGSPKAIDRAIDFSLFIEKLDYMLENPIDIVDTEVKGIKGIKYNGYITYWQPKDVLMQTVDLFAGDIFKESDHKYFKQKTYKASDFIAVIFNVNKEKAISMMECAIDTDYTSLYKAVAEVTEHKPIAIQTQTSIANKLKDSLFDNHVLNIDIGEKDKGRFMFYDGTRWIVDKGRKHLLNAIEKYSNSLLEIPYCNEEQQKNIVSEYKKLNNYNSRNEIINIMKPKLQVENADFDLNPDLINLNNCTLNIKTLEVMEHSPHHMITRKINSDYVPTADMSLMKNAVDSCMEFNADDIKGFETTLGAAMCGELNRLLMWHGSGDNGKSLLKKVILGTLGDAFLNGYAGTPSIELFLENSIPKDPDAPTPERMIFKDARLVFVSEPPKKRKLDEKELKIFITHERTSGRKLHQDTQYFLPISSVIMDTNNLPSLPSAELNVMKRVLILPFNHTFADGVDMDKSLESKLLANKNGVFRYLIYCVQQYHKYGIYVSPNMEQALNYYRSQNDTIQQFIDDCLIINSGINTKKTEIYATYKQWAIENKFKVLNSNELREELEKKGIECKKISIDKYIGVYIPNNNNSNNNKFPF